LVEERQTTIHSSVMAAAMAVTFLHKEGTMKITRLMGMTIGAAMLLSTAAFAEEAPIVSEATPAQQEEMKSDGQATMQDAQPASPTSPETSQEPAQPQSDSTPQSGQDQAPPSGNPSSN
jgi:hypothetical protein